MTYIAHAQSVNWYSFCFGSDPSTINYGFRVILLRTHANSKPPQKLSSLKSSLLQIKPPEAMRLRRW